MKSAILTVGTEILFGSILNTNAQYLSEQLRLIGHDVMYHFTVGDNPGRLKDLLAYAYHDCDLVITTGGLGPTEDDLTKEMIASYFGETIVEFPEQTKILKEHFEKRHSVFTENNLKQACFPEHAQILENPNGTAPGFLLEQDGKMIVSMPGPPREMKPMFENLVKPELLRRADAVIYYRNLRTTEIGESRLETELMDLIDGQTDPTLATYAGEGECTLRIASKRKTRAEAIDAVDDMMMQVLERVGNYVFSVDDEDLEDVVLDRLHMDMISLAAAESITGGMFAARVTDKPGVSAFFDRSCVTYSNRAKMELLGVYKSTLDKYGAISPECAAEMAEGLHKKSKCDLCVAVTGNAGPNPDEGKEVGRYYIGVWYKGEVTVSEHFRQGDRGRIRRDACFNMFKQIYKVLFNKSLT
ncbi:MAG: competence/damage-inducible protein A [Firmicutes bacterium]|nr:competence/damage-inducible protein A [Bacillota bacterium]